MALGAALKALSVRGWYAQRSDDLQRRLAEMATLRHFKEGEAIYLIGDTPNGVFGLVRGSFNMSFPRGDGEDYVMHRVRSGIWFGDLALFSAAPRLVSVHAAEPAIAVHITTANLEKLVREEPRYYAYFYQMTYENFALAFRVITNLSIPSAEKRVADRLLLEAAARGEPKGWIKMSQPELARLVALSLPTLQRIMARFVHDELIEQGYGRLRVMDAKSLRQICSG